MDEQGWKTLQKMRELLDEHVVDSPDSPPAAFRGGQVKIDDSHAPEQNPHSKMTNGALDNASKEADSQLEQLKSEKRQLDKQIDVAQKHKKALDDERTEREKNKERGMKASLGAFGGCVQRGSSPNKIPLGFKMRPSSPKQVRPGSPKRTTSSRPSWPTRIFRTLSFNSRSKGLPL